MLGKGPPQLEVKPGLLPAGHAAVHLVDLRLQPRAVDELARVELGQLVRPGDLIRAGLETHGDLWLSF